MRDVAQKTQETLFKGSNLYFVSATFQVPTTVDEAFDIMKTGTHDVDKSDDATPAADLYLASWACTQFFAAQMAALGFRFITCNLRRRGSISTPPPVDEWLCLERFDPVGPSSLSGDATTPATGTNLNGPNGGIGSNNAQVTGPSPLTGVFSTPRARTHRVTTSGPAPNTGAPDGPSSALPFTPAGGAAPASTARPNAGSLHTSPDPMTGVVPKSSSPQGVDGPLPVQRSRPNPPGVPEIIDLT